MAQLLDAPDLPTSDSWLINPAWTVFMQADTLFLSGGADEIYVVDEAASPAVAHQISYAWHQKNLHTLQDQSACQAALRQLRRIGAIVSARALHTPQHIAVVWMGETNEAFNETLLAALNGTTNNVANSATANVPVFVRDIEQADTILLIRTTASWEHCIATYQSLSLEKPHLWVDVAYHHTLVIGPYVVPHETACIHCMANRVAHRWGDAPLPATPQIQEQTPLIAALILSQLKLNGSLQWVNWIERSLSMDLTTLQTQSARVYRIPWCTVCYESNAASLAPPLTLPW